MNENCDVCGKEDLFSFVTRAGVCSVCTMRFFGGATATPARIQEVRSRLGLSDGEFFKQDHGAEAAKILGRGRASR